MLIEDIIAIVFLFVLLIMLGIFLITIYREEKIEVKIRRDRILQKYILNCIQYYLSNEKEIRKDIEEEEIIFLGERNNGKTGKFK